jgi:cell division initiation protein
MTELTPQAIRTVQFREKLRGYHPEDVDAFVADVAKGVEELEQRLKQAESRAAELESRQDAAGDAEESLRRTLVLAQRTADLAIQEARDEAAKVLAEAQAQRESAEAEAADLRDRLRREAENEGREERDRLVAERAALLADVEVLREHLDRERERLRIYFSDQLRRVEQGDPTVTPAPPMQAEVADDGDDDDRDGRSRADDDDGREDDDAADRDRIAADAREGDADDVDAADDDEELDPFLAELRRAVTDDRPLGPREDDDRPADDGDDDVDPDDRFDLFAKGEDDPGRFGSRLRRRR